MIDALTKPVEEIEAIDGILRDWVIPGGHTVSASYNIARTVCRPAERAAVRCDSESRMTVSTHSR